MKFHAGRLGKTLCQIEKEEVMGKLESKKGGEGGSNGVRIFELNKAASFLH